VDLVERARETGALARSTVVGVSPGALSLAPNRAEERPAEGFVALHPCATACLFAELSAEPGVDSDAAVRLDMQLFDAGERSPLVDRVLRRGIAPSVVEIPLGEWADRSVLLRMGAGVIARTVPARARIARLRLGECRSRVNLMHLVANGVVTVVRGHVTPSGDQLRIDPEPSGAAPVEIRIPFVASSGSCVALDVGAAGPPGGDAVAVDVGIVHERRYVRFFRSYHRPGEKLQELRDLPLERWGGQSVSLRIVALATGSGAPSPALVARPRVHRCGDGAPWGFGGG
jgi:hypothetical protein